MSETEAAAAIRQRKEEVQMSEMKAILGGLEDVFGDMEDTRDHVDNIMNEMLSLIELAKERGHRDEEDDKKVVELSETGYKLFDRLDQLSEHAEKGSDMIGGGIEFMKKYSKEMRESCKMMREYGKSTPTEESEGGVLSDEQLASAEKVLEYLEKCERGEADGSREFVMNEDGVIEGIDPGTTH